MTAAMDRIAKIFTDRLKEWRQQVIFSGCSFLIFMAVFSILGSHNIRPNIEVELQMSSLAHPGQNKRSQYFLLL